MQKYVIISAYPVTLSEKSFTALGKKKKNHLYFCTINKLQVPMGN